MSGLAGRRSFGAALEVYLHRRVIGMLFLGFSAGLPFLLVFSTLSAWLRTEDISRTTIGFFSWVGLTYSIKVFWAPVVDRVSLPVITRLLGRRRSWMLVAMVGIALGLLGIAGTDPREDLTRLALFALLVAFSSATQDIAVDAYRIEAVTLDLQGAMSATYQLGYRIAILLAGGGALLMADRVDWPTTYMVLAGFTLVGMITVLVIREPDRFRSGQSVEDEPMVGAFLARSGHWPARPRAVVAWLLGAVVCPFADFVSRYGVAAVAILAFVGLFRISDILMGVMANPFYIDIGFSLTEIGTIVKIYGTIATIVGALVGGLLVVRYGIMRPLLVGAVLLSATNLLFALLAMVGPDLWLLTATISADNLAVGFSGTVFIAYLSSLTSTAYTATQYALFSSLMTLPGKFLAGYSGVVVDATGYVDFFVMTAAAGVPAIGLAFFLLLRDRRAPT